MRPVTEAITLDGLRRALGRPAGPSSDFDLNPAAQLPPGRKLREAAVLVLVQDGPSGLELVLTRRSAQLKHHPGQIAFAGGKRDAGDPSLWDTAVREAREEIGLAPGALQALGALPVHETVTGFVVTPQIAYLPMPQPFSPEAGEVDEVFCVPLTHALRPENFVIEGRQWRGMHRRYYAVPYGPYYIWGATARILRGLAERMAP